MSNPGWMVQRSNEKEKSMSRKSLHILTLIISNNTDCRARDTKAADFKLSLPIQGKGTGHMIELLGFKSKSHPSGGRRVVNLTPGLPCFPLDDSSLCWILSLSSSKFPALCRRLSQSYERKNLSSSCFNSTLTKKQCTQLWRQRNQPMGRKRKKMALKVSKGQSVIH